MMENPYIKQYPSLMEGKKLMYVHGFGSSAQSGTVEMLRTLMPRATVVARDIPLHPAEAMEMLHRMCAEERPDLIVGSSMGGMYAEQLRGYDRILVNPAFEMGDTMGKHGMTGKQTFQNPRADGVQEFIVTKSLVKEYADATRQCFIDIDDADRQRVVGLFGDEDELVNTFPLFSEHYPTAIHFHGGHRLNDKVAMHYLIPIIRYIDDRQCGRQRPIVYIDINALRDSYGNATASMHKAYETLLESYTVFIIADAPTNHPEQLAADQAWVEKFLSAPAYDHVVFTNQRALLYGDYLIAPQPCPDFMGARIEWGSDEFKTWDEIIVYFSRLGGQ